jgi:hypothetical protein
VPEAYQDPIRRLAEACRLIANELAEHRLPAAARDQLREIAETSAHLPLTQSMSAVVILAQTRSMVADMMQPTGLEYADARELIPDMESRLADCTRRGRRIADHPSACDLAWPRS